MNDTWVEQTEKFLRQTFDDSPYLAAHPEQKAYRLEHTYRVANIGRLIAKREGFDPDETVIACLLHDLSYCEDFGETGWKEHGRRAARLARPFLTSLGLPPDRVSEICYGIAIHVDDEADFAGERTPFALTVGDADNIDRFDVYRIHETLVYDGFLQKSSEEKKCLVETRLEKLKKAKALPMGTKTAESIWRQRVSYHIGFYQRLLEQLLRGQGLITAEDEE